MVDRPLDASSHGSTPLKEGGGDGPTEEYLLGDVAIAPPLEEFRRTYAKKTRSFTEDGATEQLEAYQKAFELGESLIAKVTGNGESSC